MRHHFFRINFSFCFPFCFVVGLLCSIFSTMEVMGKEAQELKEVKEGVEPPAFELLRAEEDYGYLANLEREGWWKSMKYVPLWGDSYVSFGGEVRSKFEYHGNEQWNDANEDTAYFLQRFTFHADAHLGEHVRFFGQISSALEEEREGAIRNFDEDRLAVQQAFAQVNGNIGGLWDEGKWELRLGRQELNYGSQRLISVREATNVRRTHDGARLSLSNEKTRLDFFYTRPVQVEVGEFDNDFWSDEQQLWGAYATFANPFWGKDGTGKHSIDLYYMGFDREVAIYNRGIADETRHVLGTSWKGRVGNFDYNTEAIFQFGEFGDVDILSCGGTIDAGYSFKNIYAQPRLGLRISGTSGDRGGEKLRSAHPILPIGDYFGYSAILGPTNIINLQPNLTFKLSDSVIFKVAQSINWRQTTSDGIYNSAGFPARFDNGSDARFVGHETNAALIYKMNRFSSIVMTYAHFFAGDFLEDSGTSDDADVFRISFQVKF